MFPNRLPRPLLRTLLALLLTFAAAPASAQPVEAPELPANLRPLIPRGWVATSYAEVDMNKDGNLDRAVLLAPDSGDEPALGTIRGTPLRDRCRNLLLLVGQPNGLPAVATYLPWSKQVAIKEWTDLSPAWAANCLDAPNPPEVPAEEHWASPLRLVDSISGVRNTLRYFVHTQTDDHWKTLVIRVEQDCLRLIGSEYKYVGGDDTNDSSSTSINYLTRKRIDESDTQLETLDRNGEYKRDRRSTKTTISQTAPICLNDRPILAPSVPPPAAKPQTKVLIPVPPQAAAPPAPYVPLTPSPQPAPNRPPTAASSSNAPAGPMTVEELWRNPPPGSRITWARWSDGKEESYIRLRDGTLYKRPGITVWSARGPIRLSKVSKEILPTNLAACPDSPWSDEPQEHDGIECRGHSTWESVIGVTPTGQTAWGGFASDESDAALETHEGLSEEYEWEAWTDYVVTSDSRGILIQTSMNAEGGGAHPLEETTWQWIDPGTGAPIERAWPKGALEGVRTHFLSERDSIEDYDCRSMSAADCEQQVSEAKAELLERGGPLQPVYFEPVAACGRITRWRWTGTLMLSWAERRAEQQWTESSIAPTDIEPNPIVDCTYRPGFDGPSAVGWSAIVR